MTATPAIALQGVTVRFGGVMAVDDVTLDIAEGERLGLIGPNGAGKSTLLGAIAGQVQATRGRVRFAGHDITRLAPHRRSRLGIARTFQDARPFHSLSARQAVEVGRRSGENRSHSARRTASLLEEVGLADRGDELCRDLSYVDRKRLEVARALGTDPRVLLLDEPFSGLTAEEANAMLRTLDRVAGQRELGLVIVEHMVRLVLGFCDRVVVLDQGSVIADGPPESIRDDPAVIEAYLGRPSDTGQSMPAAPRQPDPGSPLVAPCLSAIGLTVSRDGVPVLHGVGLSLERGEVRCLLGPNGAGKTTLMEVLAGLLPADAGEVRRDGDASTVALVHQSRGLFPQLSVRDNLLLACHRLGRRQAKQKVLDAIDLFSWIGNRLNVPAANLSGGEQQMLSVARALLPEPTVLLLDEPSIGVAPLIVQAIVDVVDRQARHGSAVLICEQAIDYVLQVSAYGYILEHGTVALEGSRDRLGQSSIVQAYFGTAEPAPADVGAPAR